MNQTMFRGPRSALSLLLALAACSGDDGGSAFDTDSAGTATATATDSGSGSATTTDSDSASGTSASGTSAGTGAKFDVPDGTASDTVGETGADECTKVDLLFVVDNSGSMADNQQSLVNSFPGFVTGIETSLALAESFHVGVVTSDAYFGNAAGCQSIGDLVTQTAGPESSNQVCTPFTSGARYMDNTEPGLGGKFACAARPGSGGSDDEMVMRALLDAASPAKNDAGACNEGFLRDDALLVVVIITDEDDVPEPYGCDPDDPFNNPCDATGSGGTPDDWYAELVTYKNNIPENIVVLALIGPGPSNSCGAVINSKVLGFANRFGQNGFTGDICATDYTDFFNEALPVVDEACNNFVPPG